MSTGALESLAAQLRAVEKNGLARVAAAASKKLLAKLQATAGAGTTPDGTAWVPKKDGGRALANAATHLSSRSSGSLLQIVLRGVEVLHNRGTKAKHGGVKAPRRQILPDAGAKLPEVVRQAIAEAVEDEIEAALRGGAR